VGEQTTKPHGVLHVSFRDPRSPRVRESVETIQDFLGALVSRYRGDEVLTAVRQIPAREAKFLPIELVRDGKNVVVVTPTASGKTVCYNLPVLNAVLENADTRALYLFPTKALAQDQLAELQDCAVRAL
jgi:DEAD/DEAH box helicase domain-containing protein